MLFDEAYSNRLHVSDFQAILDRGATNAAAFRQEAAAAGRARPALAYGPSPRQYLDFYPGMAEPETAFLFAHGGYWRMQSPQDFSFVARGLFGRGRSVALAGYELCPQVTIADIVTQMRQAALALHRLTQCRRVVVYGHSAGGHLAAALLATDWAAHGAPPDLVPAAMAISGLFDLTPLIHTAMNADLRLTAESALAASPLFWPAPRGRVLDAVVGGAELPEFIRQSRGIADVWSAGGARTRFETLGNANHFTVVEPLADADSALVNRLVALGSGG